jgi:threonine/homoserine/homoserine lactone efflux protein
MRLAKIFAMALLTGFSGAMMPGPLLALTIGQVTATGFMAAIWLVTGHALLELLRSRSRTFIPGGAIPG